MISFKKYLMHEGIIRNALKNLGNKISDSGVEAIAKEFRGGATAVEMYMHASKKSFAQQKIMSQAIDTYLTRHATKENKAVVGKLEMLSKLMKEK